MSRVADMSLDDVDRRLLRVLQVEGRISNQELASRCHLSPAACHERVRRLNQRGVVRGYRAEIDPAAVDLPMLIFVEVLLEKTTGEIFTTFGEAVRRTPQILECHMVAGGFDYLLKARVRDMEAYRQFLGELVTMPGVRETRTYAVIEEVKGAAPLPI
jgi:Lrp/AsnC family leucine-responsive transcriptional regulator